MTDEQIKQNAEEYANDEKQYYIEIGCYDLIYEAYIAGAHSRNEEIKQLEKDNYTLRKIIIALENDIETANEKLQYRQDAINLLTDSLQRVSNSELM